MQKSVMRAEKNTGRDSVVVRPQLDAAMGITMVTGDRQLGWNPCAVDNGGCTHLCFFRQKNYSCGCPDKDTPGCKTGRRLNFFFILVCCINNFSILISFQGGAIHMG